MNAETTLEQKDSHSWMDIKSSLSPYFFLCENGDLLFVTNKDIVEKTLLKSARTDNG